jgi:hypothetical protein
MFRTSHVAPCRQTGGLLSSYTVGVSQSSEAERRRGRGRLCLRAILPSAAGQAAASKARIFATGGDGPQWKHARIVPRAGPRPPGVQGGARIRELAVPLSSLSVRKRGHRPCLGTGGVLEDHTVDAERPMRALERMVAPQRPTSCYLCAVLMRERNQRPSKMKQVANGSFAAVSSVVRPLSRSP